MAIQLVLLGSGHAHLPVIKSARHFLNRGIALTVVSPGRFWYSAMGTGVIGGRYTAEENSIDVRHLVERGGGRFVEQRAVEIDARGRRIVLADGSVVSFDILSLNVGSEVPLAAIKGAESHGIPAKPIERLSEIRRQMEGGKGPAHVVVIGGGLAATEIALNILAGMKGLGRGISMTVVTNGERLLTCHSTAAGLGMQRMLEARGATVEMNATVRAVEVDRVMLEDRTIACDLCVIAIGVRPPQIVKDSGVNVAPDGSMVVNHFLQSVSHPCIFGGGDCVALDGNPLPRVGVYAVREGALLVANLLAYALGKPMRPFRPQKHFLLICNCGDGRGMLFWHGHVVVGRWALWLKEWLDRRFMGKYRGR